MSAALKASVMLSTFLKGGGARLRWSLDWIVDRLGMSGVIAVGLLVMSCAIYLSAIKPLTAARDGLLAAIGQARKLSVDDKTLRSPVETAEGQLRAFYAFFPGDESVTKDLFTIYRLLQTAGVSVKHAEYRLVKEADLEMMRHDLALPAEGSYLQMRAFLSALLVEIPNLSVDRLALNRETTASTRVNCEIRVTLYYRKPP